jgi:hypothetical protein
VRAARARAIRLTHEERPTGRFRLARSCERHPPSKADVLVSPVVLVKKPAFVQIANLPPVFPLERPLQLVAEPLRHVKALLAVS